MTGFNIVTVIAVILVARMGVRLYSKWNELKKNTSADEEGEVEKPIDKKEN